MARSLRPCRVTRAAAGAASVSSAEAATVEALQPSPSRQSPSITTAVWFAPKPVTMAAATSRVWPAMMVGNRPIRSASTPNTGDSPYMPAMCRLMVKPTIDKVAPPPARWTGVIDIKATIVA